MKKRVFVGSGLAVLFCIFFNLPVFADEAGEQQQQIVIIAHVDVTDSLTKEEVKQIFLGRQTRWENDTKILFVVYTEKEVFQQFLKEYVGKTAYQYTNYWKKQVFTGKGRMPTMLKTSEEIIEFVSDTEGAMSFVMADDVQTDSVVIISMEE